MQANAESPLTEGPSPKPEVSAGELVRPFATLGLADVPLVGGKNASLGELVRELTGAGVSVPDGFATTAPAYRLLLGQGGLGQQLAAILAGLDPGEVADLARRAAAARHLILEAALPEELAHGLVEAYRNLSRAYGEEATDVAVRSSATAEDLPEASFAGQQETYLNVRGPVELLAACRRCFASLFTDRAIAYRTLHGFDHLRVALSIGVQKMVRSDLGAAGVLFTLDTETGFRDAVLVSSSYGLGENVVRGAVNPDEFYVFKPSLAKGLRSIVGRRLGSKEMKLVYEARGGSQKTRNVPVPEADRKRFSVTDAEVETLARWGVAIEKHYGRHAGRPMPMDIEWARDGKSGELFILQARPETVQARRDTSTLEVFRLVERPTPLLSGQAVGSRIGCGPVRLVHGPDELAAFVQGEVLVAEMTDPDWVPVMKKAAALVTERGGRTCHAAIVSRELGIPAVVGAEGARVKLAQGASVTVSCAEGQVGYVYPGSPQIAVDRVAVADLPKTRTRILANVADPERAFEISFLPVAGVGLARMEFIISNHVCIHPMALVRYSELADAATRAEIGRLTEGYADKRQYFVDRLALGVGRIAAAFFPREVILRLSDFKTNEYADLLGGREFEPREENPMLGFRGASRYAHPLYRQGFALECAAIQQVRNEMGLTNLKLMVPFCRTPAEGQAVLAVLAEEGLRRGDSGLEIYVMCEIPSNVLLVRDFARLFDGFSIGSNDLTQLVLGVDRDSPLVAPIFDERNPAVREMIARVIAQAHQEGSEVGICGQAPSDYPEFAAFLVDCGIDSISLNPDSVLSTIPRIAAAERHHTSGGQPAQVTR